MASTHTTPVAQQSGFTLIELITVIVLLAIIATIGSNFVVSSTESYQQVQSRAKLVNKSRQAMERMTRQLRGAVPNSIQLFAANTCIKFLPMASGGFYQNPIPDNANGAAASSAIGSAPYQVDFGTARYAIIGALNDNDIYSGGASASLSSPLTQGSSQSGIALSSDQVWIRNSIERRFFLADDPQAFCVVGNELHFLQGNTLGWTPSGTGNLMAQQVAGGFALQAGTESRSTIVDIDLDFTEGGETVNLQQQVTIRNVP
ncbi:prepilin-type N-terminal cleavage/methylation domain-containing protein [bacterium SCSIO 12696]|nr:prepilin-type N-terminal cleavage/methylation domain-containing protein [bacterium SCSIO 12696]